MTKMHVNLFFFFMNFLRGIRTKIISIRISLRYGNKWINLILFFPCLCVSLRDVMHTTSSRKIGWHYYILIDDLSFAVKGSAEEQIKKELKAVAEGVAASVLQSSTPPLPSFSGRERNESSAEPNQDGVHQYEEETQNTVAQVISQSSD